MVSLHLELSEDLVAAAQDVVSGLQVLEAMAPAVSPALRPQLLALLPSLLRGLLCPFTAIRHMCARCISAMAKVDLHHTLQVRYGDLYGRHGDL